MADTYHSLYMSKPQKCATSRVNPNVNYGPWVIMIGQFRFLNYNKCITLVGDVYNEGGYMWRGHRVYGNSAASVQSCSKVL